MPCCPLLPTFLQLPYHLLLLPCRLLLLYTCLLPSPLLPHLLLLCTCLLLLLLLPPLLFPLPLLPHLKVPPTTCKGHYSLMILWRQGPDS
jgi:hypothetical protein